VSDRAFDDLSRFHLRDATDEQLTRQKEMSDDDLLRCSQTLDLCAVTESNRRLRMALHKEEKAIKLLTLILVVLTVVLVAIAIIEALRR
jgi:hypothetical protein